MERTALYGFVKQTNTMRVALVNVHVVLHQRLRNSLALILQCQV